MSKILAGIFAWMARKAVTLVVILVVLGVGAWLRGELKRAEELKSDHASLVATVIGLSSEIAKIKNELNAQSEKMQSGTQKLESALQRRRVERQALWDKHWWARKNPLSEVWRDLKVLDGEILAFRGAVQTQTRAKELWEKSQKELIFKKEREKKEIEGQIEDVDRKINQTYVGRVAAIVRQEFPMALGILAGIIVIPIGIKVFLYFVVAPWAAGRPSICILPSASGRIGATPPDGGNGKVSGVSLPVVLGENQELLIQPDYLQSKSLGARTSTKWLLNSSIPFSSLLSGMFLLTRVGPAGSEPVVISSTKDPLSEIGLIDLADGAAFVCQPRGLAGVIQDRNFPIRISRHWRLGSLQSWLTLQLRFLAFHGPGQLVVKGCRGIRVESAGSGRLINQAATLGFSANLAYANTRCETFMSYWSGKEDLFNDLFTGQPGIYVYEEMPSSTQATGITGRGLEGFADAVLKVFGV